VAPTVSRVEGDEAAVATEAAGNGEKRVTRDVEPIAVRELLDAPPRATVAFRDADAVELMPARARCEARVHWFGVSLDAAPDLAGREVVLMIDDGMYWFELRGISVRGVARHVDAPEPGAARRLTWYAIDPRRVLAWDYGAIREE
jgi:hypothetical protein